MRILLPVWIALTLLLLSACGGGGGTEPSPEPQELWVDAQAGADGNPGTQAQPVATISRALALVTTRAKIQVLPGTYASGETFPLVLLPNVTLVGDILNKGAQTRIVGAAPLPGDSTIWASLVIGEDTSVLGFDIKNPLPAPPGTVGYAVYIQAGGESGLAQSTIDGSQGHGVGIAGSPGAQIFVGFNRIRNNVTGAGIHLAPGLYLAAVYENELRGNSMGVRADGGGLDLGGGPGESTGHNTLAGNLHTDLFLAPNLVVPAQDNLWDNVAPITLTTGGGGGGADIYNPGNSASVDTTGASLAP